MTLTNRYSRIIEHVFFEHFNEGDVEVSFERDDIVSAAAALEIDLPKNLGDVVYSVRYRTPFPDSVVLAAPDGLEWIIDGAGRAKYKFRAVSLAKIEPQDDLEVFELPDATPGLIAQYALSDEQALLARLRYNRLIDVFLGITCYSLQNHLRTTVPNVGQIETDEIYVGIDSEGGHHIIPVQAKGGTDSSSTVQIQQDIDLCAHKFPEMVCHPIAAQFMGDEKIALLELTTDGDSLVVTHERHYVLT